MYIYMHVQHARAGCQRPRSCRCRAGVRNFAPPAQGIAPSHRWAASAAEAAWGTSGPSQSSFHFKKLQFRFRPHEKNVRPGFWAAGPAVTSEQDIPHSQMGFSSGPTVPAKEFDVLSCHPELESSGSAPRGILRYPSDSGGGFPFLQKQPAFNASISFARRSLALSLTVPSASTSILAQPLTDGRTA